METSGPPFPADIEASLAEATPEELAESVAEIKRSLAEAAAEHTRDLDEVFDDLEARYHG
jgi:hypothetical protein